MYRSLLAVCFVVGWHTALLAQSPSVASNARPAVVPASAAIPVDAATMSGPISPASYGSAYGGGAIAGGTPVPVAGGPTGFPSGARAFGRSWGSLSPQDWERFYHYPYVYYPHNFWGNGYFRSSDSLYYRYPSEMRIPVYNRKWHNYYPSARPFHKGHHFYLDVF